jgi:hypothetical protein
MSTRNIALAVLLAILVGVTASLTRYNAAREGAAVERLAFLAVEDAVLNTDIHRLGQTNAVPQVEVSPKEAAAMRDAPQQAAVELDPALTPERMRANTIRAWLQLRNGPLYVKLGLNTQQIAEFESLETEHWLRVEDIVATARAGSLRPSDPAIVALHKEESTRFNQAQKALLGESGFNNLREYQRTLPARALTSALAGNVFYSDPLTPQQGEQLTRILASNSATYAKGDVARMADLESGITLAQAQTVLSPEQFAVFKRTYLASQAGQKLSPLLAAASKTAPVPAPAIPPSSGK